MSKIKHGEVWLANLNPGPGTEPGKLRPVLVAQSRLEADSDILIDQVRAINNRRLIDGPLLTCTPEMMARVYAALSDVMDMPFIHE